MQSQSTHREVVEQLCASGITWDEHDAQGDLSFKPLAGKTVVLTGMPPTLSRKGAQDIREVTCAEAGSKFA